MQQPRRINADDFRIRGEKLALFTSVGLLIVSLLVLVGISFGLILILIVISVALVKVRQGQLLSDLIGFLFLAWSCRAEYSSDRGGAGGRSEPECCGQRPGQSGCGRTPVPSTESR